MMRICIRTLAVLSFSLPTLAQGADAQSTREFDPETDLISLHYNHAPDKDDGQSAAADRTVHGMLFGADWNKRHVVAVSCTYGKNKRRSNPRFEVVLIAAWNHCGGWIAAPSESANSVSTRFATLPVKEQTGEQQARGCAAPGVRLLMNQFREEIAASLGRLPEVG